MFLEVKKEKKDSEPYKHLFIKHRVWNNFKELFVILSKNILVKYMNIEQEGSF